MKDEFASSEPLLESAEENSLAPLGGSKKTSMFGVLLVLINTTIGSGTLLIPYCFKCGLAEVIIVAFVTALIALWSLFMLYDAAHATGATDYPTLFQACFGRKWVFIMDTWIFLVLFGTTVIYVNWCGRLVKHILPLDKGIWQSQILWNFICAVVLVFPLTIFRSLDKLQSWSGLAVCFILLLIVHALYWMIKGMVEYPRAFDPAKIVYFALNKQLVSAFGIYTMAYDCHCNIFGSLGILHNPTRRRARIVMTLVVAVSFVLYNAFGVFSYLYLFDDIGSGAVVEYYDKSNWFTKVTIIGVILIIVLGAPMMVMPTRNCLINLFWAPPIRKEDHRPVSTWVWILLGAGITLSATALTAISSNIVFFFDLVGGLLTPGFVFTMPSVFYLMKVKGTRWWEKFFAAIVILASVGATCVCTYQVIAGN